MPLSCDVGNMFAGMKRSTPEFEVSVAKRQRIGPAAFSSRCGVGTSMDELVRFAPQAKLAPLSILGKPVVVIVNQVGTFVVSNEGLIQKLEDLNSGSRPSIALPGGGSTEVAKVV